MNKTISGDQTMAARRPEEKMPNVVHSGRRPEFLPALDQSVTRCTMLLRDEPCATISVVVDVEAEEKLVQSSTINWCRILKPLYPVAIKGLLRNVNKDNARADAMLFLENILKRKASKSFTSRMKSPRHEVQECNYFVWSEMCNFAFLNTIA